MKELIFFWGFVDGYLVLVLEIVVGVVLRLVVWLVFGFFVFNFSCRLFCIGCRVVFCFSCMILCGGCVRGRDLVIRCQ